MQMSRNKPTRSFPWFTDWLIDSHKLFRACWPALLNVVVEYRLRAGPVDATDDACFWNLQIFQVSKCELSYISNTELRVRSPLKMKRRLSLFRSNANCLMNSAQTQMFRVSEKLIYLQNLNKLQKLIYWMHKI